ncbi:hypothetical protein V6N11_060832 [Hibiscus sabdariffa]|uniref:Uncharacterized protein n=1 Tax=Hibiscus sabdariffa TaxID=183260 RepID=A0ABR2QRF5_9ROSI
MLNTQENCFYEAEETQLSLKFDIVAFGGLNRREGWSQVYFSFLFYNLKNKGNCYELHRCRSGGANSIRSSASSHVILVVQGVKVRHSPIGAVRSPLIRYGTVLIGAHNINPSFTR